MRELWIAFYFKFMDVAAEGKIFHFISNRHSSTHDFTSPLRFRIALIMLDYVI
jgi:hypothetical protein